MATSPKGKSTGCCYLHIGLPKTATKTLQMGLFARHSQVDYLGTYTGESGQYRQYRQCRDADIERLFVELLWENYRAPNLPMCREIYTRRVEPSLRRGLTPVFSWESLMENHPDVQRRRAENLRAIFGSCRVLVTLRHPVKLVESLYLQLLKRDNVGQRARLGKKPVYSPIGKWLDQNWDLLGHAPRAQLEYAQATETFADVFGADQVGVFLFEQLVEDPDAYFASLCTWMGVDPAEGVAHTCGQWENQRWTQPQLDRLKAVRGSLVLSTVFRLSSRRARRTMLGFPRNRDAHPAPDGPPARVAAPDPWPGRIHDKTREGNRRLMQRWGLPLDRYQYPL
jgi:hypothetical protein